MNISFILLSFKRVLELQCSRNLSGPIKEMILPFNSQVFPHLKNCNALQIIENI